jgi:hypothetical protein
VFHRLPGQAGRAGGVSYPLIDQLADRIVGEALLGVVRSGGGQPAQRIVGVAHTAVAAAFCQQAAQRIARIVGADTGTVAGDQVASIAVGVGDDLAIKAGFAGQPAFRVIAEQVRIAVDLIFLKNSMRQFFFFIC